MSDPDWQPTAAHNVLQARAQLNQQIRDFFRERQVLEVETPLLSHGIGTDPNLHPIAARYEPFPGAQASLLYLQTSPEFAMKRLVAAGSGAIFQLCKAFRNGESGQRHNPEFSMLEWYRPGLSVEQLIDEVQALVDLVLHTGTIRRCSYGEIFQHSLQLNPHTCTVAALREQTRTHIGIDTATLGRDSCLELLYGHVIEPTLQEPVFIYDYPASQAALARRGLDAQGHQVARRFELVVRGMELANGYDELVDPVEQQLRFTQDRQARQGAGLPPLPGDQRLVKALVHGMPPSAGVALGVDRLLMLALNLNQIDEVLTFAYERA